MKILIIGGSRFVGPILIDKLASEHELTVFNRGTNKTVKYPDGVSVVAGDRDKDLARLADHFDAVIDMCAYNGEQTNQALTQLSFDYFLHFGSVASYKKSEVFPLDEDAETGEWPFMGDYGKGKVECEQVLASSKVAYAIIRPTYILGPANYVDRESFIYRKIMSGEEIVIPGNGQALVQFIFADEVAETIKRLVESRLTGAYNCVGNDLITLTGLVQCLAEIAGKSAKIRYNPAADGSLHDESEFPFANENLVCKNTKIVDLGVKLTPLKIGLKRDFENYYREKLSR